MNETNETYRLYFHLTPPVGWLNDPNGLCEYRGRYHVFFQYAPESPLGGRKFWGHYVSPDLIRWKFLGTRYVPIQSGIKTASIPAVLSLKTVFWNCFIREM